jgi:hypothetical protein
MSRSASKARNLELHDAARRTCDNAIFISGNGRSGTTILGKLIHSMNRVEYVFEPPTLVSLLPLVSTLDVHDFRLLFETCCYEDLLMGQVTGRALNLNRNDDSCIYIVRSLAEIENRIATVWSKSDAVKAAAASRLAIKIPDVTVFLPALKRLYPGMNFVVIHRHANPVISSVLKKRWFSDDLLLRPEITWPTRTAGFTTPAWVEADDVDHWKKWSELERAAYYFCRSAEGALAIEDAIYVSYDRLITDPVGVVGGLAARLGLEFGERTPELIAQTKARSAPGENWTAQLPNDLQKKITQTEEAYARVTG